jgi:hypothetical protein
MKLSLISLTSLATLFAAGAALAQEGTQDFDGQVLSTRTRAQVLAELDRSRVTDLTQHAGEDYASFEPREIASTRSRSEVLAELAAARRARAVDGRSYQASYGSFRPEEITSTKSRAEVRDEMAQTRAGLSRGDRSGG